MTENVELHRRYVQYVHDWLIWQYGIQCEITTRHGYTNSNTPPGDIRIAPRCDVAVLVANTRVRAHHVRIGGRMYVYAYPMVFFNRNVHKVKRRGVHYWVLIVRTDGKDRFFVVPSRRLSKGKTLNLLVDRLIPGGHWIMRYENRWDLLVQRKVKEAA